MKTENRDELAQRVLRHLHDIETNPAAATHTTVRHAELQERSPGRSTCDAERIVSNALRESARAYFPGVCYGG